MVSVATSGNTSWVCDPSLVSYPLEQPEMLRSHDYKHSNVMHKSSLRPLYPHMKDTKYSHMKDTKYPNMKVTK